VAAVDRAEQPSQLRCGGQSCGPGRAPPALLDTQGQPIGSCLIVVLVLLAEHVG